MVDDKTPLFWFLVLFGIFVHCSLSTSVSTAIFLVAVVAVGCRRWLVTQHHHLQSAGFWTSHQSALSTDRNRWCQTSFVALHRRTDQSWPVAISSARQHTMTLHSAEVIQERTLLS